MFLAVANMLNFSGFSTLLSMQTIIYNNLQKRHVSILILTSFSLALIMGPSFSKYAFFTKLLNKKKYNILFALNSFMFLLFTASIYAHLFFEKMFEQDPMMQYVMLGIVLGASWLLGISY
jgi:hypothetical protein